MGENEDSFKPSDSVPLIEGKNLILRRSLLEYGLLLRTQQS